MHPTTNSASVSSAIQVTSPLYLLSNKLALWHNRPSHANAVVVKFVLKLCNVPLNNKHNIEFCNSCCLGKSHRLYAPVTSTEYSSPFELTHTDLRGPSPSTSSQGF